MDEATRLIAALEDMANNPKRRASARAESQKALDFVRDNLQARAAHLEARQAPPAKRQRDRLGRFIASSARKVFPKLA